MTFLSGWTDSHSYIQHDFTWCFVFLVHRLGRGLGSEGDYECSLEILSWNHSTKTVDTSKINMVESCWSAPIDRCCVLHLYESSWCRRSLRSMAVHGMGWLEMVSRIRMEIALSSGISADFCWLTNLYLLDWQDTDLYFTLQALFSYSLL